MFEPNLLETLEHLRLDAFKSTVLNELKPLRQSIDFYFENETHIVQAIQNHYAQQFSLPENRLDTYIAQDYKNLAHQMASLEQKLEITLHPVKLLHQLADVCLNKYFARMHQLAQTAAQEGRSCTAYDLWKTADNQLAKQFEGVSTIQLFVDQFGDGWAAGAGVGDRPD
ncbi:MAG: hypothetical protein HC848_04805 [Limnobacter sp.]|nr:hypothetical protein [Limnobacter sp.]